MIFKSTELKLTNESNNCRYYLDRVVSSGPCPVFAIRLYRLSSAERFEYFIIMFLFDHTEYKTSLTEDLKQYYRRSEGGMTTKNKNNYCSNLVPSRWNCGNLSLTTIRNCVATKNKGHSRYESRNWATSFFYYKTMVYTWFKIKIKRRMHLKN